MNFEKYPQISKSFRGFIIFFAVIFLMLLAVNYAQADTATYYFNSYNNVDSWDDPTPSEMVDGSTSTYSQDAVAGEYVHLNTNEYTAGGCGSISAVEVRSYIANNYTSGNPTRTAVISMKPYFGGITPGTAVGPSAQAWATPAWTSYYPITNDGAGPGTWSWNDIANLDMRVTTIRPNTGTVYVYRVEIRVTYDPTYPAVTISGSSNIGDGTITRVAVNNSLQAQTGTVSSGSWTISGVTVTCNGLVTVFATDGDGDIADASESTAIGKYSGSGNMTNMVLNANVLSIGGVGDQNIAVSDLTNASYNYDNGDDEDVMHTANSSTLTVDGGGSYSSEKIDILASDTLTVGGTETLNTHDIAINGTLTSGGASAYNISGSWDNNSNFNANASTVTFTATSGSETIDSTGATTANFYNLTLGSGSGSATWSLSSNLYVSSLNVSYGTLSNGSNNVFIYYGTNFTLGANGSYSAGSGTFYFQDASASWTDNNSTKSNMGAVVLSENEGYCYVSTSSNIVVTSINISSSMSALDITDDTLTITGTGTPLTNYGYFTTTSSTVIYTGTSATNIAAASYHNLTLNPGSGTQTHTLGTAGSQTFDIAGNLTVGGTSNLTVDWTNYDPTINVGGNLTLNNNTTWTKSNSATLTFNGTTTPVTWTDSNGTKQDIGAVSINGTSKTVNLNSSVTATSVNVASGQTLGLGSSGYVLTITGSGTGASRPFIVSGSLTEGTNSTVKFTGTTASDIQSETYHHLELSPSGGSNPTHTLLKGSGSTGWGDSGSGSISYNSGGTSYEAANAITRDGSGNIYVAGYIFDYSQSYNFRIVKYDSSGVIATGWGDSGSGSISYDYVNEEDFANAITIDGSGNIYVAGYSTAGGFVDFRINKYDSSGVIATGWGDSGSGSISYNSGSYYSDQASAITIDGSGNIYVAGYSDTASEGGNFRINKYDSSGVIATGWGDSGSGSISYNSGSFYSDYASAITIDGSNNIYVAGYSATAFESYNFRINKYDSSGVIASGWGDSGSGSISYNSGGTYYDFANAITRDGSGNIYVAGYSDTASEGGNFRINKYDSSGVIATGWGDSGSGSISYNSGGAYYDQAKAITIDGSGNIYVAGYSATASESNNFRIVKYDSSGVIATGWGDSGSGSISYNSGGTYDDQAKAITIDGSGNIYAAGYSDTASEGYNFRINKYDSSGDIIAYDGPSTITTQNFTVGDGTNSVTVTAATNNPNLDINGNLLINNAGSFTASSSGQFTVAGNWANSGTFTHNSGTVTFDGTTTIFGSSTNSFNNVAITGALTGPTSANMNVAGSWTNGGTFTGNSGTVTFNATSGTPTISGGGSPFYNVIFNSGSGNWTFSGGATVGHNLTITSIGSLTLPNPYQLEVNGTYSIVGTETSKTAWNTGSTFYLNGTSQTIIPGDVYATLKIGANTDIRMWNSSATTYTVDSSGSLYSMDHAAANGDLYIWGDYHVPDSATDYWSYATDFDGTAGANRKATVKLADGASVTVGSGETWQILGVFGNTTDIDYISSGSYAVTVNNGTLNANYYKFQHLNSAGLNLTGSSAIITNLANGEFENSGGSTSSDTFITVADAVITNNPAKDFAGCRFGNANSSAEHNVTATGTTGSYWTFSNSYGDFDGGVFESDPAGNPGYIRWSEHVPDSSLKGKFEFKGKFEIK